MVRSNKNKLFIGALALLIVSAQPMEAISFSSVQAWATSLWNSITQDLSFSKVLLTAGTLGAVGYFAYHRGADNSKHAIEEKNRYRYGNFLTTRISRRLDNRQETVLGRLDLPPIPVGEVGNHLERITRQHIHAVWPLFSRLIHGRIDHNHLMNYFVYCAQKQKPGVFRIPQDNDDDPLFTVDWNAVSLFLNGKLHAVRELVRNDRGHNEVNFDDLLAPLAVYRDYEHNIYQLPVLEQGVWSVPENNFYYEMSKTDGANCGYHSLKNAHYMLEFFREPNRNKRQFIEQLTMQDYYTPRLHQWRTEVMLQPNRANPERLDWIELADLQNLIDREVSLVRNTTVVPRINQENRLVFAEGDAAWAQAHNVQLADWPVIIDIRDELRRVNNNNYRHAFILHVHGNHWISLVVHKANDQINFYVANSLQNVRAIDLPEVRSIVDFLVQPEAQPEAENNEQNGAQDQDPEAAAG